MGGSVGTDSDITATHEVGIRRSADNLFESACDSLHFSRADPQTLPHQKRSRAESARYRRARNRASFRVRRRGDAVLAGW